MARGRTAPKKYECTGALAGVGTQHATAPSSSRPQLSIAPEKSANFFLGSHSKPIPKNIKNHELVYK